MTPGHVTGARMVLANAAFFKGVWLYQFKKSATAKGLFYSSFEDYTFVDMMRQKGNFRYGKEEEEEGLKVREKMVKDRGQQNKHDDRRETLRYGKEEKDEEDGVCGERTVEKKDEDK